MWCLFIDDDDTGLDHFRKIVGGILTMTNKSNTGRPNRRAFSSLAHRIFP